MEREQEALEIINYLEKVLKGGDFSDLSKIEKLVSQAFSWMPFTFYLFEDDDPSQKNAKLLKEFSKSPYLTKAIQLKTKMAELSHSVLEKAHELHGQKKLPRWDRQIGDISANCWNEVKGEMMRQAESLKNGEGHEVKMIYGLNLHLYIRR